MLIYVINKKKEQHMRNAWLLPEEYNKAPHWLEDENALQDVLQLDDSPRDWNYSPLRTDFAIASGRVLNIAFMATVILAAPPALAWGTGMTLGCLALGIALNFRKRLKLGKEIMSSIDNASPAPAPVKALAENIYRRAGLDDSTPDVRIIRNTNGKSSAAKQLPYTVAIMPKKNIVLIGEESLRLLDRDELQAIIAHESSHYINQPLWAGGKSITENGLSSGTMWMAVASLCTMNFLSAGYYAAAAISSQIGRSYLKKLDEYRADRNAVALSDHPQALISGLKKLEKGLLQGLYGYKWRNYQKLNDSLSCLATHPHKDLRKNYIERLIARHRQPSMT